MANKLDIISSIIKESESYSSMNLIESYVEKGMDLSSYPAQPLYLCLKSMPPEKAAQYLQHFSKGQRKVFLNLDLWQKDSVSPASFDYWLKLNYVLDNDELKKEFVESSEFLIFLKSRFNIWTFDVEDPQYPEHDNYFLTDDNLLLFEFEESFEMVEEVRELIRHLYFTMGVERAYTYLFKIVQDSYMNFQEQLYQEKKELLRDYGFVDYYDALSLESPWPNIAVLDNYIGKKAGTSGEIDTIGKQQALHNKSLISFKDKVDFLLKDLSKIEDEKRLSFLQFDFIQLINGTIALKDSLHHGPVAMTKVGVTTRNMLELGLHYIKSKSEVADISLFERFEFKDLYRIGHSLVYFVKKDLKKALAKNKFDEEHTEAFLGQVWVEFLDLSFEETPQFNPNLRQKERPLPVLNGEDYKQWKSQAELFIALAPFVNKFYETFNELKSEGVLQDDYYMNYSVDQIDFEAIILSTFINDFLGNFEQKQSGKKLGLAMDEFKKFVGEFIVDGKLCSLEKLQYEVKKFSEKFGFNDVASFDQYLLLLLETHLEGYDYADLQIEDFQHVGGPIILTTFS